MGLHYKAKNDVLSSFCLVVHDLFRQSLNGTRTGTRKKMSRTIFRVPTRPGKPGKSGKMRVHLENLEISWNFENFNKYDGKIIKTWKNLLTTKNLPQLRF